MTIISPHRNTIPYLNVALIVLSALLVVGVIWLIVIYNYGVNMAHALDTSSVEIERTQGEISELKDAFFTLFSTERLEILANERNLIKDKNPQYLQIKKPWELASQY